jgi:hypothetical protein
MSEDDSLRLLKDEIQRDLQLERAERPRARRRYRIRLGLGLLCPVFIAFLAFLVDSGTVTGASSFGGLGWYSLIFLVCYLPVALGGLLMLVCGLLSKADRG